MVEKHVAVILLIILKKIKNMKRERKKTINNFLKTKRKLYVFKP
jgi:hypothetical protein